ncbi:ArsR family transcriptional regulator [Chloroflexota bacterium]
MDSAMRNPRDMTDEEVTKWMQELMERAADEKGCAGAVGACSFEAVKNPVRRGILKNLAEKPLRMDELSEKAGLGRSALQFHLNFLQNSSFVKIEGDMVDLTPGGVSFVRNA